MFIIIWVVWAAAFGQTSAAFVASVAFGAYLMDYFLASCLGVASFRVAASLVSLADSYLEFVVDSVISA